MISIPRNPGSQKNNSKTKLITMNRNIILSAGFCAVLGLVILVACEKDIKDTTIFQIPAGQAIVKIHNTALATQRNFIYVDDAVVNATGLAYNATFPTAANNYGFALKAGARNFLIKDTTSTTTQPPLTFSETLDAGKVYTMFLYDTLTSVKKLTVPTEIVIPDDTTARVRLANFAYMKNGTPTAIDIFSVKRNANVFTNIAYATVTPFIAFASSLSDTLVVRQTGSTSVNLDTLRGFNPTLKRSYTLVFAGRYSINEAGGANPRTLTAATTY
jgi:hypothetical protein